MSTRIQFRRGTAAEWTSANPILAEGELGLELDTRRFKVGVGTTSWNNIEYASGTQGVQGLQGRSIQGIQGPAGSAQGTQGTQGVAGQNGAQGTQGLQGLSNQGVQGVQGPASAGGGSLTVLDNTTTEANWYVGFLSVTAGTASTIHTSSTKFNFNPSTGTLSIGGDLNSGSDERLKKNIETIGNALETIQNLRGVRFNWNQGGKPSMGVIAQELEKVVPELVSGDEHKTVTYNGLIAILIEAVKELKKQVEELSNNK